MRGGGKRVAMGAGALALVVLGPAMWFSWPRIRFWWVFEPLGTNAQGYHEYRHRKTGIVFVSLPGGKSWMGAQKDDPKGQNHGTKVWESDDGPVHEVALSPVSMGKYEVTQAQWRAVMADNPSHLEGADLPVERVSWEDCQEFCRRAGLNLPTEAQWEYACRGGASAPDAGGGDLYAMAWHVLNSGGKTHPVGKKEPNGFGLHDMSGNVFEWCEDVYDSGFYHTPEAAGLDPVCSSGSEYRVMRGGSFYDAQRDARCTHRSWGVPLNRNGNVGFRVVASPPP